MFVAVYPDGDPAHARTGVSTYPIAPGQSVVSDITMQQPGKYPFVDHSMWNMEVDAVGIIEILPRCDLGLQASADVTGAGRGSDPPALQGDTMCDPKDDIPATRT